MCLRPCTYVCSQQPGQLTYHPASASVPHRTARNSSAAPAERAEQRGQRRALVQWLRGAEGRGRHQRFWAGRPQATPRPPPGAAGGGGGPAPSTGTGRHSAPGQRGPDAAPSGSSRGGAAAAATGNCGAGMSRDGTCCGRGMGRCASLREVAGSVPRSPLGAGDVRREAAQPASCSVPSPRAGGDGSFSPPGARQRRPRVAAAPLEESLRRSRASEAAPALSGPRWGDAVPPPAASTAAVSSVPRQCHRAEAASRAGGSASSRGAAAMGTALSTGAVVAISFNCIIALLILILFHILCKACRTPSCPKKSPASDADEARNEEKYLLQP